MRKITENATQCFMQRTDFRSSNTRVVNWYGSFVDLPNITGSGSTMFLHDNPIAILVNSRLFIQNCGLFTNTTKERLNGLPNVNISQRKGEWYLNDKKWDGNLIEINL